MDIKPVIILGAGGIGRAALEIFKSHQMEVFCFLDDDAKLHGTEIDTVSVMGKPDDDGFLKYIGHKCDAFVAEDDNARRKKLVKLLKERRKVMPTNAVHSHAVISDAAHLGYGNFVNAGVLVGNNAKIESHCILHSGAVIEHNTHLKDFVQIGAGSTIGADVEIGEEAFIGSGVTIVGGVKIGKGARVGAGSVVVRNVEKGETVFGNPAQKVE